MIGQASQQYIGAEYVEAIATCQAIITLEPALHDAWRILASCHHERRDEEKALQCETIMAHLRPDVETWKELGKKSRSVASVPPCLLHRSISLLTALAHSFSFYRDHGNMQQAIYCYRKAIAMNPTDIDAIWDRAYLLKETGDNKRVRPVVPCRI